MVATMRGLLGDREATKWMTSAVIAGFVLYMVGFVDGSVHAAALGETSGTMNYVHELFHHARHVAFMCH